MSAAWTLFYSRRYRSRRSEPDPEPDIGSSSRGSDHRRSRHDNGGGRRRSEDRDPHRRSPSHRALRADPEPVRLERTNSKSRAAGNSGGAAVSREDIRTRIIRTHPLPAPVEEARQRLVERLGDFSLAGSREVIIDPNLVWDRIALYQRFAMPDAREREPVILGRIEPGLSYEEFSAQLSEALVSRDVSRENIPRINLEAQQREIFRNSKEGTGSMSGPLECCICLEKFQEGNELIMLNCAHRFHTVCLEPWVVTSGNCPYCRASIA